MEKTIEKNPRDMSCCALRAVRKANKEKLDFTGDILKVITLLSLTGTYSFYKRGFIRNLMKYYKALFSDF